MPDEASAGTEADSLRGMTDRTAKARTTRKATAKARATAGPSTAQVAKGATCFAQDDSMFELVQEDGAQDDSFIWVGKEKGKGLSYRVNISCETPRLDFLNRAKSTTEAH
jgi:hypothetical protein